VTITSVSKSPGKNLLALGTSDGIIILARVHFSVSFEDEKRFIEPRLELSSVLKIDSLNRPITKVVYRKNTEDEFSVVALTSDDRLIQYSSERISSLLSEMDKS